MDTNGQAGGQTGQKKKRRKTRMSQKKRKELALEALENSLGIISSACRMAEIPRSVFYEWMEKDPKFAEKVNEIGELSVDFSESALLNRVRQGDTTAIIFHLKTKGKHRGYGQELSLNGNLFDSLFREFNDRTDDELAEMLNKVTNGKK